jgi:L-threonylcarbamoyladenylate synthase
VKLENDILKCIGVLEKGGLILYPTDTIWGIGCDATNREAVEKIYRLKKRPGEKSMIVLIADEREIGSYVANPDERIFHFLKTTKRPTTVIYEHAYELADNLVSEHNSVAIRVCREPFCSELIRRFKKPIVSTSANYSGESFPATFADIKNEIADGVDYVVHYRQNDKIPGQPSAVIKWEDGKSVILRP